MCELIERKRSGERARVCSHDCIVSVWPWRASDLWKSREREKERSEKHILYHRSLSKVSEFSCLCTHSEQQRRRRYSASTTLETPLFSMMNIVDEVSEWKGIDICVTEKKKRKNEKKSNSLTAAGVVVVVVLVFVVLLPSARVLYIYIYGDCMRCRGEGEKKNARTRPKNKSVYRELDNVILHKKRRRRAKWGKKERKNRREAKKKGEREERKEIA